MATDTGKHLPYADNCVAMALSKTLSKPQAKVVEECIENYAGISKWSDLEEDTKLKAIFTNVRSWRPVRVGGGTWTDIKKLCKEGAGAKTRYFAIHWGAQTEEKWGIPDLTFHAICIQVKGGSLAVFGNNEEPQRRKAGSADSEYVQTGSQVFQKKSMKDSDWVSAWSAIGDSP